MRVSEVWQGRQQGNPGSVTNAKAKPHPARVNATCAKGRHWERSWEEGQARLGSGVAGLAPLAC